MTFDDELLISKTLLRIAPVPMPSKDGMDVAEMVRGVPSKEYGQIIFNLPAPTG